jgi:PEP-CTERM/exosortase A-associated glycosyltransferase
LPVVYEIRAFWEDAAVDLGTCREGDLRYRATRALETHVCRKADAVVTICEGLKNDLTGRKNIDDEKVVIVGNAVDTDNLLPSPPDDELAGQWGITGEDLVLGFVGSFYHYEGLDLLLEVMPRITEKFPMVKLLLVGGGPMEKKLRALAVTLGLADQVIFTGRIPHQRVPGVYAMMDIMVFPRYSMRLTETVTPLKPLEAMALQKVVLASNVGGHRELIRDGDTGLLFQAGNGDDLASRLVELIRSAGLRKSLVERGACFVKHERTWRSNGEKYRELYRKILSEN